MNREQILKMKKEELFNKHKNNYKNKLEEERANMIKGSKLKEEGIGLINGKEVIVLDYNWKYDLVSYLNDNNEVQHTMIFNIDLI